jgi:hypothetical protein
MLSVMAPRNSKTTAAIAKGPLNCGSKPVAKAIKAISNRASAVNTSASLQPRGRLCNHGFSSRAPLPAQPALSIKCIYPLSRAPDRETGNSSCNRPLEAERQARRPGPFWLVQEERAYSVVSCFSLCLSRKTRGVRKFTVTLTVAALVLATMGLTPVLKSSCAEPSIHALKNATPIVRLAGCNGATGVCGCGPGWVSACAPRGCCRCVPCW